MSLLIKLGFILLTVIFIVMTLSPKNASVVKKPLWEFEAIDTMKYSRDTARAKLNDPSFDLVIEKQISQIADTGATHVGIATPYDEEFYPFLKRWVDSARKHNLKVWFRGNFSGWEGWFEYPKITRAQHIEKTKEFILNHPEIFEDGDAFSACPECENGGPGDPRMNGDAEGHTKFLIEEYQVTQKAFEEINKDVDSHYHSMNGDVARLIMEDETTEKLGNFIVVDHYVRSPHDLASDIEEYSNNGKHDVILGEYGAPIPDIHGEFTEEQQAQWLKDTFSELVMVESLSGLSYWTNVGGSTELWDSEGNPRKAVDVVTSFYNPPYTTLTVKNEAGEVINGAKVRTLNREYVSSGGVVAVPHVLEHQVVSISHSDYVSQDHITLENDDKADIVLVKSTGNWIFSLKKFFNSFLVNAL